MLLIIFFPPFCFSQSHLEKANKLYNELAYSAAIPEYEKSIKQNHSRAEATIQLAHCYRLINNSKEAEKWYSKAVVLNEAKPECMLYYTQALMSNGDYQEAEKWILKYMQVKGTSSEAEKILASVRNLGELYKDSLNFSVQKLRINSDQSDFCPVMYDNGIVFASARERFEMVQRTHQWTGRPFYSLYYAKNKDNDFSEPEIFARSILTKYNDGPVCFSKSGDEMYVTRNNIEEGKVRKDEEGIVKLKIFQYKKSGTKWVHETRFPYNSNKYNCAYPCLTADGSKMYFSSDMPGGFGSLDIYVCTKTGDSWGKPVNLGAGVNTADNDAFPFVDNDEGLYFATTGRGGLGGYDIFYSSKSNEGYIEITNLGYPVNSSGDDFGWVQNASGTSGYFSSNRVDKNENDDIYSFKRNSPLLNVFVYDARTKQPLVSSRVRVMESGIERKIVTTSDKGTIKMFLAPGKDYKFIASLEKYVPDSGEINVESLANATVRNLSIALNKKPLKINIQGKVFYNADSSAIAMAEVSLVDLVTHEERRVKSNADGTYHFDLIPSESRYRLVAKRKDCISTPIEINIYDLDENQTLTADLALNCVNDIVKLDNIYYDYDKYIIRRDATIVLDRLADFLKSNPEMNIELRSHTDCRGTDNYNLVLSQRRAKSAVDYLIKRGISSQHLTGKGYGETMLINHCACEGNAKERCTDEENQVNRRTEFKILNFDQASKGENKLEVLK